MIFLINIELDVKFSFGTEQSQYVFKKGQELGERAFLFITGLIILNLSMLINILLQSRKKKK
jgi:hypothetical protein